MAKKQKRFFIQDLKTGKWLKISLWNVRSQSYTYIWVGNKSKATRFSSVEKANEYLDARTMRLRTNGER